MGAAFQKAVPQLFLFPCQCKCYNVLLSMTGDEELALSVVLGLNT